MGVGSAGQPVEGQSIDVVGDSLVSRCSGHRCSQESGDGVGAGTALALVLAVRWYAEGLAAVLLMDSPPTGFRSDPVIAFDGDGPLVTEEHDPGSGHHQAGMGRRPQT